MKRVKVSVRCEERVTCEEGEDQSKVAGASAGASRKESEKESVKEGE